LSVSDKVVLVIEMPRKVRGERWPLAMQVGRKWKRRPEGRP
jgi:hypothetical protein